MWAALGHTCIWSGASGLTGQGIWPDIVVAAGESGHKSHKSLASFTNTAPLRLRSTQETARDEDATQLFFWLPSQAPVRFSTLYPGESLPGRWERLSQTRREGDWESGRSNPHCNFLTLWLHRAPARGPQTQWQPRFLFLCCCQNFTWSTPF